MAATNSKVTLTKKCISDGRKRKPTSKKLYNAVDIALKSSVCATREQQQTTEVVLQSAGCQNLTDTETTNATEVRKRFAKSTDEDIATVKQRRFETNTIKNTTWGVKIFRDWLLENSLDISFESLEPRELDALLAQFYVELRKVDGKYYSKVSYTSIRAAIQRHLQNPPWNVTYTILSDAIFLHSNQVLKGVFKTLTEMGECTTTHYKSIEKGDIKKLKTTGIIGTHNPQALLNLVWFSVALQFGKRGQEGYRLMSKETFKKGTDDLGSTYYEYAVCEAQKNHSGKTLASTHLPQGRMYAKPGDPLCPVAAMDKYLSLLHPDLECLWQRPNQMFKDENSKWYCKSPLGHNTLSNMMKKNE